jgi:polyhydroxyalkanoate synthesis regulator phasin
VEAEEPTRLIICQMTQNPEDGKHEEKDPPPEHTPSTDGNTSQPGETAPAPTPGETNGADATNGSTSQAQVYISEGSLQDDSHAACPETLGPSDLNDKATATDLATTALNNETRIAMAEMQEATINRLNDEVHQLKNEVNDLKAKNQGLTTTALNNKTRLAVAEMQEASITGLNKEVDKLKREVSDLTAKNQRLLVGTADALDKFEKAQADNESLRAQILGMLRPPGPVHDDGHYRQQLDLLNERIQGWVAAAFKAPSREPLPESSVHAVSEFLSRYDYGRSLLAAMAESNHTINHFYERPVRRVALVRYIMALILWQDIFSPYCFGISVELNEVMLKVLDSVYCDGTHSTIQN